MYSLFCRLGFTVDSTTQWWTMSSYSYPSRCSGVDTVLVSMGDRDLLPVDREFLCAWWSVTYSNRIRDTPNSRINFRYSGCRRKRSSLALVGRGLDLSAVMPVACRSACGRRCGCTWKLC